MIIFLEGQFNGSIVGNQLDRRYDNYVALLWTGDKMYEPPFKFQVYMNVVFLESAHKALEYQS
jgi:hypothetical protein